MHIWNKLNVIRYENGMFTEVNDDIVEEFALTVFLNNCKLITLLCSPDKLVELVVGFLGSEGIVKTRDDILNYSLDVRAGCIHVTTRQKAANYENFNQNRAVTTGFGKGTIHYDDSNPIKPDLIASDISITAHEILSLEKALNERAKAFKLTGGVHNCALCNKNEILIFAEDIGRHNALDKMFGEALMKGITTEDKLIMTSGRISTEMLLKAAMRKIPCVISRSAPTAAAVNMARDLDLTLVGFARNDRMNIYSGAQRIVNSGR